MNNRKMDKCDIIPGFQAIMPLNICDIDPIHRKQAISQHENDIKVYTKYQNELSPRLRYENTMKRIQKIHENDYNAVVKRKEDATREQMRKDELNAEYTRRIKIGE
jgi:hypothetical protein